ncbi:MAG TPA: hypothetical protein VHY37_01215, partial [Tepidisphaeraceae bacterium]|nr:hypothetical protein [Tepidisphaeraceae bacterium]
MNIGQLQELLLARKSEVAKLHKQRADLAKKLAQVDQKLSRIDGTVASRGRGAVAVKRGGRKRAKNAKSLADMINDALSKIGKAMSVGDIMEAVQDAGYRTTSPSFRGIVNQTLIKDKRFTSS